MARKRNYDINIGRQPPFDIFEKRFLNTLGSFTNPDFPRVIKPLPYHMIKTNERYTDCSYELWSNGQWTRRGRTARSFLGSIPDEPSTVPPESLVNDVRRRAENAFLEDVASVRVNLLDLYRTRIETANMVVKNVHKLINAYRNLRKGKWRQFQRTLGLTAARPKKGWDNIPALWLEYSYGWAPLIGDVYTILNKTFEPPEMYVRRKYSSKTDYRLSTKFNRPTNDPWCLPKPGASQMEAYCEYSLIARGVTTGFIAVDAPALQAISQYGINNPALVAWEAIPFSFVVDWFVPIGNYIEMMGATGGLKFIDCSTTVTVTYTGKSQYPYYQEFQNSTCEKPLGTWALCDRTFEYRRKVRSVSDPQYSFGNLSGPMDQSVTRLSYALSLLANIFSSKAR